MKIPPPRPVYTPKPTDSGVRRAMRVVGKTWSQLRDDSFSLKTIPAELKPAAQTQKEVEAYLKKRQKDLQEIEAGLPEEGLQRARHNYSKVVEAKAIAQNRMDALGRKIEKLTTPIADDTYIKEYHQTHGDVRKAGLTIVPLFDMGKISDTVDTWSEILRTQVLPLQIKVRKIADKQIKIDQIYQGFKKSMGPEFEPWFRLREQMTIQEEELRKGMGLHHD